MFYAHPVLGPDGWVSNEEDKMVIMFENLFVVEKSQSLLHLNETFSMGEILSRYTDDLDKTMTVLEEELKKYYEKIYPEVFVQVRESKIQPNQTKSRFALDVDITITKGNNKYSLGAELSSTKLNSFKHLIKYVN